MFGKPKNKEEHRYYLLPGMGRSNRHHREKVFKVALVFGVIFSLVFGAILYVLNLK